MSRWQALLRFYNKHNKGKAGNVDHILKLYRGREREMFTKVRRFQAGVIASHC